MPFYYQNNRLLAAFFGAILLHVAVIYGLSMRQENVLYAVMDFAENVPQHLSLNLVKKKKIVVKKEAPKEIAKVVEPKISQTPAVPVVKNVQYQGRRTPPTYPKRALRLRQEGTVILRALVNPEGKTETIKIIHSSGFSLLDNAAIDALNGWRLQPTMVNNQPILSWIEVPVEFLLTKS